MAAVLNQLRGSTEAARLRAGRASPALEALRQAIALASPRRPIRRERDQTVRPREHGLGTTPETRSQSSAGPCSLPESDRPDRQHSRCTSVTSRPPIRRSGPSSDRSRLHRSNNAPQPTRNELSRLLRGTAAGRRAPGRRQRPGPTRPPRRSQNGGGTFPWGGIVPHRPQRRQPPSDESNRTMTTQTCPGIAWRHGMRRSLRSGPSLHTEESQAGHRPGGRTAPLRGGRAIEREVPVRGEVEQVSLLTIWPGTPA